MVPIVGMAILASALVTRVGGLIEAGGVIVLFGLLFACGVGLPLPEDIPLTIAGFLIAKGQMHLAAAGVAAWCGIIGGDLILYHLGRKFGPEITRVPFVGKHVTVERIEKAGKLFAKYGIGVVAIGRLFAGIRGAMVIAAGATKFSLVKFIIADGLAALVSGGLFIWLGHWVGTNFGSLEQIQEARKRFSGIEHVVLWVIVLVAAAVVFRWWWRRRKHAPPVADRLLDKVVKKVEHPEKTTPRPENA